MAHGSRQAGHTAAPRLFQQPCDFIQAACRYELMTACPAPAARAGRNP